MCGSSLRLFPLLCLCALFILQLWLPILSSLLSVSDSAWEAALLNTLYYILRTSTILSHYYIIAFGSLGASIQRLVHLLRVMLSIFNTRYGHPEMEQILNVAQSRTKLACVTEGSQLKQIR